METLTSQVVAQENQKPSARATSIVLARHAALRNEVGEPMIGELKALEAGLEGAELETVQQYRLAVEGFFAAVAAEARTALAR